MILKILTQGSQLQKNEGFEKWIHVLPLAATSKRARFGLDIPGHNKGGTKVAEMNEGGGGEVTKEGQHPHVLGMPIDDLGLPSNRPVVLKLDVEGHEQEALAGAEEFICGRNQHSHNNIVLATMEIRGEPLKKHEEKARKIFLYLLNNHGLVPFAANRNTEIQLDPTKLVKWVAMSMKGFMDVMRYPKNEMDEICERAACEMNGWSPGKRLNQSQVGLGDMFTLGFLVKREETRGTINFLVLFACCELQ